MESVQELNEIIERYSQFENDLLMSEFLGELKEIRENIDYAWQE